jgi:hypothetical protein
MASLSSIWGFPLFPHVPYIILFPPLFSFMENALRIGSGAEYVPNTTDVLRARAKSVGIAETRSVGFLFFFGITLFGAPWR